MISYVIATAQQSGQTNPMMNFILFIPLIFIIFMMFSSSKKSKKEMKARQDMLDSMAVGDSVVTTSGFYGVILDLTDEDVIVEFGNNKNCRIPMKRTAIHEVEKADSAFETK